VGVLACVLAGRSYVPINPKFPIQRQTTIASIAACSLIISDENSKHCAATLIRRSSPKLQDVTVSRGQGPLTSVRHFQRAIRGKASDIAYIMFTSGTTGAPKGVAVRRNNLSAYLSSIEKVAPILPETRCTQLFDLSFDLSVHDIFQTWASGGCLYVMGNEDALDPVGFAKAHALQAWFSVPSVVAMASRMRRLVVNGLPDVRLTLFCGEALPASIAKQWASVAPNSKILNLYGPTEATIAITSKEFSPKLANGYTTVPLGEVFPNCAAVVVDENKKPARLGELWLGGAQVSNGYINDEQANQEKFVCHKLQGFSIDRWYRTGDLVHHTDQGDLVFVGRMDDQVKIQGYRVELLEVEEALRQVSGSAEVAAVPWPITETGSVEGIVGFVCAASGDAQSIIIGCRAHLPIYASPRKILFLDRLPLNANGKVDRNALRTHYLA